MILLARTEKERLSRILLLIKSSVLNSCKHYLDRLADFFSFAPWWLWYDMWQYLKEYVFHFGTNGVSVVT